jgi:hypothetical protein
MPDSAVDSPIQLWEKKVHALVALISIKKLMTVDELRQGIEDLNTEAYKTWGYYDKWAASAAKALLARGVLKSSDFPQYFGGASEDVDAEPKTEFAVGDLVRVKGRWSHEAPNINQHIIDGQLHSGKAKAVPCQLCDLAFIEAR